MRAGILIAGLACCVMSAAPASAQQPTPQQPTTQRAYTSTTSTTPNRDVILEIPELSVDSIGLTVADVKAHVALDANAMNLVQVTAGVDVGIKKVQLGIVGVLAEAYLYVDLDNVAKIVNRVVQTLDRNPQILIQVLKTVDTGVNAITGQQPPQP
jgi:transcriptional accessory protein Tex/SPT6